MDNKQHELSEMIVWKLGTHGVQHQESSINYERCYGEYERGEVLREHQEHHGKYRAICKIYTTYGNGKRYEGTGFLINDHIVVTAAHNVFYREDGYACIVQIHVGYRGDDHVDHEGRVGEYVAVHRGYTIGREYNDFAVIMVKKPFNCVNSYIQCERCPEEGNGAKIAIAGYPGDIPKDARGKYMYESQGDTNYNLDKTTYLLEYRLDTNTGNSGSPVLKIGADEQLHAIAVHTGSRMDGRNCAVPIGHMGNDIEAFERGIGMIIAPDTVRPGCDVVTLLRQERYRVLTPVLLLIDEAVVAQ